MALKPESKFLQKINKQVTGYKVKLNVQFNNGIPDCYYSGSAGDLWVEYKWIPKLPVRNSTEIKIDLSPAQLLWLHGRCKEGRNVAVIVGSPEGCVILTDCRWEQPLTSEQFRNLMVQPTEASVWINHHVGVANDPTELFVPIEKTS